MSNSPFIGTGHNPGGADLPLGLGALLAQDPSAMDAFAKMSNDQKNAMIGYIQGATSGKDAKNRMASAIQGLHNGQITF